jgi:inosine triphosphate pyrophosphatase
MLVRFITGNKNKLLEFKNIMQSIDGGCSDFVNFESINFDLPEFQGEPEHIAKQKVKMAYEQVNCFNISFG